MLSRVQVQVHFSHDLGWGTKEHPTEGTLTTAGLTWSICPHKSSVERSTGVKFRGGDRPVAYEQAKGGSCPLRFLTLRIL